MLQIVFILNINFCHNKEYDNFTNVDYPKRHFVKLLCVFTVSDDLSWEFSVIFFKFVQVTIYKSAAHQYNIKGVSSWAQNYLAQDSMTNYLYFHTREFSRIFSRIE